MVTWEEVYPDEKIRRSAEFDAYYSSKEQYERIKEKTRINGLVKAMLRDTKI
jgi:hypothetical protein